MGALLFTISATPLAVGCVRDDVIGLTIIYGKLIVGLQWAITKRQDGAPDEPPEIGCNVATSDAA